MTKRFTNRKDNAAELERIRLELGAGLLPNIGKHSAPQLRKEIWDVLAKRHPNLTIVPADAED